MRRDLWRFWRRGEIYCTATWTHSKTNAAADLRRRARNEIIFPRSRRIPIGLRCVAGLISHFGPIWIRCRVFRRQFRVGCDMRAVREKRISRLIAWLCEGVRHLDPFKMLLRPIANTRTGVVTANKTWELLLL